MTKEVCIDLAMEGNFHLREKQAYICKTYCFLTNF